MANLEGQCAIVTGGSGGIGFAAAERLASEGASVVIADVQGHENAAAKLVKAGFKATAVTTDVTSDAAVEALVAETMRQHGRIDILVNNAALISELKPTAFEDMTPESWLRVYDVNVVGMFRMCRAVSPHMRAAKSGRIINISSGTVFKGVPGTMHYVASKSAVIGMTRSLANEFSRDKVIVNAIAPGFTLSESMLNSEEHKPFIAAAVAGRFLKRDELPVDVANVIYFLAGPDSAFMTGQVLSVDGGSVLN